MTTLQTAFIWVRSVLFLIVFYIGTLTMFILFSPTLLMPRKWAMIFPVSWSWLMPRLLRIMCGIRLNIKGLENLPKQNGFIVASKHQSALETIVFHAVVPQTFYILKRELMWLPLAGIYFLKVGCIPIDRKGGTKTMRLMLDGVKKRFKEGMNLVIFPEGTRTKPGTSEPYKPGIALLYEQCKVPVVPVALNTGYCWPKNQTKKLSGTVTISFLPPIEAGMERRTFLNTLQEKIESEQKNLPDPFKQDK